MTPAVLALVIQGLQFLITEEPTIAAQIQAAFASGTPTIAQLEALKATIQAQSYETFDPSPIPSAALDSASSPTPANASPSNVIANATAIVPTGTGTAGNPPAPAPNNPGPASSPQEQTSPLSGSPQAVATVPAIVIKD
jgi:hypothetical protein